MLDAHMDELGGVVRRVTKSGFLSMQMLGGWLDQALPDQRWIIIGSKGPVRAVTGIRDIHVVPMEERAKVFDAFYQVDSSSTREYGGTGLGLSIVKRLVDAHEGRVTIEDNHPHGAVFVVTLPVDGRPAGTPSVLPGPVA